MLPSPSPAEPWWAGVDPRTEAFLEGDRPLSEQERAALRGQGCEAADWDTVSVRPGFRTQDVRSVRFSGRVALGATGEDTELSPGLMVPAGIRKAHLAHCRVGDHVLLEDVSLLANVVVGHRAVIARCGEISHRDGSAFGNDIRVGMHHGGADRRLRVFAELAFEDLGSHCFPRDARRVASLAQRADAYAARLPDAWSVVGEGVRISATSRIRGCLIGPSAEIDGATLLEDVTLLSSPDAPTIVGAGVVLRRALLQWGCAATDAAFGEDIFMAEASGLTRHGILRRSAIGSNTEIAEGEVSTSVVGPNTGFHHQALLVATSWPEGGGNVGYGANVGSNHTGRAPDQEMLCGPGVFFGLGVNVKMPADFSTAAHLLIATGTDTLPQRVRMPFALILPATSPTAPLPPGYNEIRPGWGLYDNVYGLLRSRWKFARRNRATRLPPDSEIFSDRVMRWVEEARDELASVDGKAWYTDRHLPGLGKNGLSEKARIDGIKGYDSILRWYGLRAAFARIEAGRFPGTENSPAWDYAAHLLGKERLSLTPGQLALLYLEAEQRLFDAAAANKQKDEYRGTRVIADYGQAHAPTAEDPFLVDLKVDLEALRSRVRGGDW